MRGITGNLIADGAFWSINLAPLANTQPYRRKLRLIAAFFYETLKIRDNWKRAFKSEGRQGTLLTGTGFGPRMNAKQKIGSR